MNKYHEIDPDQIVTKQVNELYILWIMKKVCAYMNSGKTNSEKIKLLQITHGLLTAIRTLPENDKIVFLHELHKKHYIEGVKLFNKHGRRRELDHSLAIKAALVIMESNDPEWKEALTQKILETQKTIKKMANSIDKKRKEKSHKNAKILSSQNSQDQANIKTNPTEKTSLTK